jgi:hypothetical protein
MSDPLVTTVGASTTSAFNTNAANNTIYQITTPWAKDVSQTNPLPEYPRPQMTRQQWQNLNGRWQYSPANPGASPPIGKDLPGRILVPYPPESLLSGIRRHDDFMFYRRTFTVPSGWDVGKTCSPADSRRRLQLAQTSTR